MCTWISLARQLSEPTSIEHSRFYTTFGMRALTRFSQVATNDPACAMAYWGAAMMYNHPFWDPPSKVDEMAAWDLVQKGLSASEASTREQLYLAAVAVLYKDGGEGSKSTRDQNYRDALAAAYAQYPDDETALFFGLSILGATQKALKDSSTGSEQQSYLKQFMFVTPTTQVCFII